MKKQTIINKNQKKSSVIKKDNPNKRYSNFFGIAIILLLGVIIYSNSFDCTFHFDDSPNIIDNPTIQKLSDVKAWWNFYPTRPVAVFTFAVNFHFHQFDVRYWHYVNLLIHLINACLVWWLTLLIFSTPAMQNRSISNYKKVIALFTALLFVSHPVATQSVTYIVQRMASLVALFYLLSLALYLFARLYQKRKYLLYAGSIISATLAMLTKENAFTLPLAVVLLEIFFLQKRKIAINFKGYRIYLALMAFLGLIIFVFIQFAPGVLKPIPPANGITYTITPQNYLLTQFSVIVKYIQILVLPVNLNLDYDFPISNSFFETRTLISFLFLLSLIVLAIYLFKKNRIISFGIFWFFITLSIESSIVPIEDLIFEHRTYLPSVGFFLIISSLICGLLWERYKYPAIVLFVIIIGSNSILTFERNKIWKNELTLWKDVAIKSPNKARPYVNRGFAYTNLQQWDNAISDYSKAIELAPKFVKSYLNRGAIYYRFKQWDKAINDYSKAIEINPKYAQAYYNRGIAYNDIQQVDKAIADYTKAIELDSTYSLAYNNRGLAYKSTGQFVLALADFSKAIDIDPKLKDAFVNRGVTYYELGQYDKSISDYNSAVRYNPDYEKAYYSRGNVYNKLGQLEKAIADYSEAIALNPKYFEAYYNRGNTYVKNKQWEMAIKDYSSAIAIEPNFTNAYYNRGVAFGNLGQWEKAIADYTSVIQIDPNNAAAYSGREYAYLKFKSASKQ